MLLHMCHSIIFTVIWLSYINGKKDRNLYGYTVIIYQRKSTGGKAPRKQFATKV